MKKIKFSLIAFIVIIPLIFNSCEVSSSASSSRYRTVNHYHHGVGVWGSPYYGGDVIIIEDDYDIGMPDVIDYPVDHY